MEAALGLQSLHEEIASLNDPDEILHIDLKGRDPDAGSTDIPYEKGALFLLQLEETFGRARFDRFLRGYFDHFAFQSITTDQFHAYLKQNLLDKFPGGNFGLLTSLAHEYRSGSRFPTAADSSRVAPGYRTLTFKLEIRVQTAVISYQFRDLLQEKYSQIPGYNLPRQTQFYGVRWDFWN